MASGHQLAYNGEDVSIEAELSDNDIDDAWDYGLDEPPYSRAEVHSARPLAPREHERAQVAERHRRSRERGPRSPRLPRRGRRDCGRSARGNGHGRGHGVGERLPCPLRHPSLRPGEAEPAKASECGPVPKTLYRLGARSVPFLVVRTNDGDPLVRRWTAHLLGELPAPESTHAVARRFFDTDEAVRRAALAAGRLLLVDPDFGPQLINEFAELAEDRAKGMGMRLASIEALADLRLPLAVPALIRVLADGAPDIEEAARAPSWWWLDKTSAHTRAAWVNGGVATEAVIMSSG